MNNCNEPLVKMIIEKIITSFVLLKMNQFFFFVTISFIATLCISKIHDMKLLYTTFFEFTCVHLE